jgi:hypothetical protein
MERWTIDRNTHLVDADGETVAIYLENILSSDQLNTLLSASRELLVHVPPTKETSSRGKDIAVIHLGIWTPYCNIPFETKKTQNPHSQDYLVAIRAVVKVKLFLSIRNLLYCSIFLEYIWKKNHNFLRIREKRF